MTRGIVALQLVACVAIVACDSATELDVPRVLSMMERPSAPLTRSFDITLARAAPVAIDYWSDDGVRLQVTSDGAASTHTLVLPRLRAGKLYHYSIVGTEQIGSFTADTLPADLAAVRFTVSGASTLPLVLVHLFAPNGFKGYAIVNTHAEVVWYFRTESFPYGMTRRANGNFVFMDGGRGLVEVTPGGTVVAVLPQDTLQREQHHDVIATPQNTLLFLAFDERSYHGAPLKGEAVWEWSPENGTVLRRWTSWDFFTPERDRGPRFGAEWMHANALHMGPRGNVLISVHYFNQIVSVAPTWDSIEWRLGGVNATIGITPEEQFSGQHTAREIAPGHIIMFDNRRDTDGPTSRAVEFGLVGNRAQKRWEWSPAMANYTSAVSSARRLDNGNTLIAFGMDTGVAASTGPTEVYEVTPDFFITWRMVVRNTQVMYRAEPMSSIAGEREVTR
jgi:hypothetical protein